MSSTALNVSFGLNTPFLTEVMNFSNGWFEGALPVNIADMSALSKLLYTFDYLHGVRTKYINVYLRVWVHAIVYQSETLNLDHCYFYGNLPDIWGSLSNLGEYCDRRKASRTHVPSSSSSY